MKKLLFNNKSIAGTIHNVFKGYSLHKKSNKMKREKCPPELILLVLYLSINLCRDKFSLFCKLQRAGFSQGCTRGCNQRGAK